MNLIYATDQFRGVGLGCVLGPLYDNAVSRPRSCKHPPRTPVDQCCASDREQSPDLRPNFRLGDEPSAGQGPKHCIDRKESLTHTALSFDKAVVTSYRIHLESRQLAPGTIDGRLAAGRRLAYEAADSGLLSPDLAAAIRRVKGPKNLGVRLGNWLSAEEARTLLLAPDPSTLKGKRDRALVGLLLGCRPASPRSRGVPCRPSSTARGSLGHRGFGRQGPPRSNCAHSRLGQERHRFLARVGRRGRRPRVSVRLPGRQTWGSGVTERVVWHVVKDCAKRTAIENLASHDLRRYAESRTMPYVLSSGPPAVWADQTDSELHPQYAGSWPRWRRLS
jgi:integrase